MILCRGGYKQPHEKSSLHSHSVSAALSLSLGSHSIRFSRTFKKSTFCKMRTSLIFFSNPHRRCREIRRGGESEEGEGRAGGRLGDGWPRKRDRKRLGSYTFKSKKRKYRGRSTDTSNFFVLGFCCKKCEKCQVKLLMQAPSR